MLRILLCTAGGAWLPGSAGFTNTSKRGLIVGQAWAPDPALLYTSGAGGLGPVIPESCCTGIGNWPRELNWRVMGGVHLVGVQN